jgi:HD-GYP domain-containing protein (c-di-GMP phosphodiesterase class II)
LQLTYMAGRGFRSAAAQKSSVHLGQGYAGRAALERRMEHVTDPDALSRAFGAARPLAAEGFVEYYAVPLLAKGNVAGVLELFHRQPIQANASWLDFLAAVAGQAAIAIDNIQLFEGLERSNAELALAYDTTIEGWSRALDLRDKETEGHSQRVTELTLRLAAIMGVDNGALVHLRRGALLHDIGKMGVPDAILLKPGLLTPEESALMQRHPALAYDMLSPIEYLQPALDIPYCHHEKWDGSGYPRGLTGEQIPLAARIFAVVDVWDALCSERPYRPAWPTDKVRAHIRALSGSHFDPQVVDAFLQMV